MALYQQIAALPGFGKVAKNAADLANLRRLVKASGIECGDTVIRKARDYSNGKPGIKSDAVLMQGAPVVSDAWTLPNKSTLTTQPEPTKKAPAQGGKWKRFVACFDVHGDKQHRPTVDRFFQFTDQWQPEIKIMGGDLWDFRPLRRNASGDEKRESMQEDYVAGMGFLIRYSPQYLLRGNHDERLWELAQNGVGVERDFASSKIGQITDQLEQLKIRMLRYHIREGILQLGHLKVAHGFYAGVNCAKQMAQDYGCIIFGHNHVIQVQPVSGLDRSAARCCGAMCELIQPYNERRPSTLRHANGWAYGVLNESSGFYHLWQAEEVGGEWIVPSDVVALGT